MRSKIFSVLTLGHLHTFIHEFGHAATYELLSGGKATINLSTKSCYGSTTFEQSKRQLPGVAQTYIDLAGPLADVIFSAVLIVGIFALTHYVPMPIELSWSLRAVVCIPAAIWIGGEFLYAAVSITNNDNGDFGNIAKRGIGHLLVSLAVLITIRALCALGTYFLL